MIEQELASHGNFDQKFYTNKTTIFKIFKPKVRQSSGQVGIFFALYIIKIITNTVDYSKNKFKSCNKHFDL